MFIMSREKKNEPMWWYVQAGTVLLYVPLLATLTNHAAHMAWPGLVRATQAACQWAGSCRCTLCQARVRKGLGPLHRHNDDDDDAR